MIKSADTLLRPAVISVSFGAGFGLTMWFLFDVAEIADLMTVTFLFVVPFAVGAISVYSFNLRSFFLYIALPVFSIILLFSLVFLLGIDGALCLVILAIPFLTSAVVGGLITASLQLILKRKRANMLAIAALPFLVGPVESRFDGAYEENEVISEIVVYADRRAVWEHVTSVDSIEEHELPWTLIHAIGVPQPVSAMLDRQGTGGVRHITWHDGIRFEERIINWSEGTGFSYDFVVDTACLPLYALDKHVRVGGEYFDVLSGSYTLVDLSDDCTLIRLHCRYRLKTRFNWYARVWGDVIINDFQRAIAHVIKGRAESVHLKRNRGH